MYVLGNPLKYIDPTGHIQVCADGDLGGGCGSAGAIKSVRELIKSREEFENKSRNHIARAKVLDENGWDLVPGVSDIRHIIRGSQVAGWASQQPGFADQQAELLGWQNNCYGQCHYADATDLGPSYPSIGGPMPNVPHVDLYSSGVGEIASGFTNLVITSAIVKGLSSQTHVFSKGGIEWHLGLETKNNMSIIHIGNHPEHGIHIAFGSVRPFVADLHVYLQKAFPFFRIWRPPRYNDENRLRIRIVVATSFQSNFYPHRWIYSLCR
jgi:hypothetical protein